MAEAAVPRKLIRAILEGIGLLRLPRNDIRMKEK
jgi:hypothetical protein